MLLTILIFLMGSASFAVHLPPDFPVCRVTDSNFHKCLTKGSNKVRRFLKKGLPDIGIQPIDPLLIPEVFLQSGTEAINLKANLSNVVVNGLSKYHIDNYFVAVNNRYLIGNGTIENITVGGDFIVNGKILQIPLTIIGKFETVIDKSIIDVYQKFDIVTRNNKRYMSQEYTNSTIKIQHPRIRFVESNINKTEIKQLANSVIKENVDVLFDDLKPQIEKIFTELLVDKIVNPFQKNVPVDQQFPGFP